MTAIENFLKDLKQLVDKGELSFKKTTDDEIILNNSKDEVCPLCAVARHIDTHVIDTLEYWSEDVKRILNMEDKELDQIARAADFPNAQYRKQLEEACGL